MPPILQILLKYSQHHIPDSHGKFQAPTMEPFVGGKMMDR